MSGWMSYLRTTPISSVTLNHGPAAVRSPADRLFTPDVSSLQPSPAPPPSELGCETLQPTTAGSRVSQPRIPSTIEEM